MSDRDFTFRYRLWEGAVVRVHVIDGANGFVASHLIGSLLARGDEVIALARASAEVVRRRVADALCCLGFDESPAGRLRVRGLALDEPDLGLPVTEVFAEPCTYWHVAALVTFFPRREEELLNVNVTGSANTLATYERHAGPARAMSSSGRPTSAGSTPRAPFPRTGRRRLRRTGSGTSTNTPNAKRRSRWHGRGPSARAPPWWPGWA